MARKINLHIREVIAPAVYKVLELKDADKRLEALRQQSIKVLGDVWKDWHDRGPIPTGKVYVELRSGTVTDGWASQFDWNQDHSRPQGGDIVRYKIKGNFHD